MATVSGSSSTQSRRKSLDAEINLVPFIDLLSMCICFLLITAVWIQIGSLQVKQSRGTEAAPIPANTFEMELHFARATAVDLLIKKKGASVKKFSFTAPTIEELAGKLDVGLKAFLAASPVPIISSATITPRAGVSYGNLVAIMDQFRKNKIINLGVIPVASPGGK